MVLTRSASSAGLGAVEVLTEPATTSPAGFTVSVASTPSEKPLSPASDFLYRSSTAGELSLNSLVAASTLRAGSDADSPVTWTLMLLANCAIGPVIAGDAAGAAADPTGLGAKPVRLR